MEQQINNENKTKQANREYKSRLFSYIFGREETKDRTLSRIKSFTDRQTDRSGLHPFMLRLWLAFLGEPCMGAVTEIKDFDSTPRQTDIYRANSALFCVLLE